MDIYQLLKKDHKEAKDLFKKIQDGDGEKTESFAKLRQELLIHMEGEEKLFYPVLKKNKETREKTEEGIDEHKEAKKIIKDMHTLRSDGDGEWEEKFEELQEAIEHHVQEEEEELFPMAKHVLSAQQATQIAEKFQQAKQQKMAMQT